MYVERNQLEGVFIYHCCKYSNPPFIHLCLRASFPVLFPLLPTVCCFPILMISNLSLSLHTGPMSSSVPRFHVQHDKYTLFKPVETMIKNGILEPKDEIQNPGTGLMQVGTTSNKARRGTKTFRNNRTGQIAQRPKYKSHGRHTAL